MVHLVEQDDLVGEGVVAAREVLVAALVGARVGVGVRVRVRVD